MLYAIFCLARPRPVITWKVMEVCARHLRCPSKILQSNLLEGHFWCQKWPSKALFTPFNTMFLIEIQYISLVRPPAFSAFDIGSVPAGVLLVRLGNRLEKLVEPPLTLGVEILDVTWNHRGHCLIQIIEWL